MEGSRPSAGRPARAAVACALLLGVLVGQGNAGQQAPAIPDSGQTRPVPPLAPLAVTQLDDRQRALDLEGRVFSLRFAEPVAIRELLLLLVRDTDFSIVPDPDVTGVFIGELKNVTLREALQLVLQPLGLDYSVEDRFIHVFRERLETRLFDINYVITRRSGRRTLSAATSVTDRGLAYSGPAGPGMSVRPDSPTGDAIAGSSTQVESSESADLFQEIEAGIETLLSDRGRFNLDRKAALLQVADFPDRLDKVSLYLDAVQSRVHRQVQIQARVVEVELTEEFAAGIDWTAVFSSASRSVTGTQRLAPMVSAGVVVGVETEDFSALVRALSTQGRVNVLSSPRVVAMNNEPAIMRVGTQDVFFVTTSQVDVTTGRVLQTTVTPHAITEGVVLTVTPQVSADGVINMNITPSVTERIGEARSRLGDVVPILSVREADTLVRVHEGETIVIAGLMQDRVRSRIAKVPLLGDIPVVGGLFRRQTSRLAKTDLVVLLTPTVLTPGRTAVEAERERTRLDTVWPDRP